MVQIRVQQFELPVQLNPALPLIFDTDTLSAEAGVGSSILWFYITHPSKGYNTFPIKTRKKTRIIHAPIASVKYFSTNILRNILEPVHNMLGKHVTAYRKNRTIRDAVLQHIPDCPVCSAHYPDVAPKHLDCPRRGTYIHLDLKDFFHSTTKSMVRAYFNHAGYTPYVSGILASLCTTPINGRYGVPQGNPMSGALCNLVADERLDVHVLKYVDMLNTRPQYQGSRKWVYTRYSDDMAFTCGCKLVRGEVQEVIRDVYDIIRNAGYTPNVRKTRYVRTQHKRRLLGSIIHQIPNCDYTLYDRVKGILHRCARNGLEQESAIAAEHHQIPHLRSWLVGNINWINHLNPRRGAKLKQRLQSLKEICEIDDTLLHISGE